MSTEQLAPVLGAIHALYGMEGVERQREANTFLLAFADSESAWGVGTQLLLDESLHLPPEALFFAANMLHAKARRDWAKVSATTKSELAVALRNTLEDAQTGRRRHTITATVFRKICAVYAVVLVSAPDDCKATLEHLVAPAAVANALASRDYATLALALTLARCISDELTDAEIPFAARDAMDAHVHVLGDSVTSAVAAVVTASDAAAIHADAFECLRAWLAPAGVSLSSLYTNDQLLLNSLLTTLSDPLSSQHLRVCADILAHVVAVAEYPPPSNLTPALLTVARGLLATRRACEQAVATGDDDASHALTTVITAFCEAHVEWIVAGTAAPEAVALGELVLALSGHPQRQIAALTLEFWLLVADEPVASRLAFYQRPAFEALLDVLLRQCAYDASDNMDELARDDLLAFRTGAQGVADAFAAVYALDRNAVLSHLVAQLAGADTRFDSSDWPRAEAALFALSVLADDVKKRLDAHADTLVAQVFECVFISTQSSPHAIVVTAAAKLLGQFAAWLNARADAIGAPDAIAAALQYLDVALRDPTSSAAAARSFMQVATTSAAWLAMLPSAHLIATATHVGASHLAVADRLLVVEGLVRAAAVAPHGGTVVEAVLTAALARLNAALDRNDEQTLSTVSDELRVLGTAIRFLDAPADVAGGRALTAAAVELVWPHLARVVAQLSNYERAMAALFQLYGWCLQSLRDALAPHLDAIVAAVVTVFAATPSVAPLECASVAVDVFGRRDSSSSDVPPAPTADVVVVQLQSLLTQLSRTTFTLFSARSLSDAPDVLRAFFELAYRYALFCPSALFDGPDLPVLIDLALAGVKSPDRASANAVLVFLTFVVSERTSRLARYQSTIDAAVLSSPQQLAKWLDAIVSGLAAASPSVLFDALGRLLFAVLSTYGDAPMLAPVLEAALTSPKADALGAAAMAPGDRMRVQALWLTLARSAPTRQIERRFRGLSSDFAKICRQELTADALDAYEWDAA